MPRELYRTSKLKRLKDPKYAALYLKTSFDQTLSDGDYEAFLVALKDVVEASGSVQQVADEADITRQHLYLLLSGKGNPTLQTLAGVLKALHLTLDFIPFEDEAKAA